MPSQRGPSSFPFVCGRAGELNPPSLSPQHTAPNPTPSLTHVSTAPPEACHTPTPEGRRGPTRAKVQTWLRVRCGSIVDSCAVGHCRRPYIAHMFSCPGIESLSGHYCVGASCKMMTHLPTNVTLKTGSLALPTNLTRVPQPTFQSTAPRRVSRTDTLRHACSCS